MAYGMPGGYVDERRYQPQQQGQGSGLPNDLMSQIQSLLGGASGSFGQFGRTPMQTQAPRPSQPSGLGQQYLAEIKALMQKLGSGGLPKLDPTMTAEFAQRKGAMQQEIDRNFREAQSNAMAGQYSRGMERSSVARNENTDISGGKAQAISAMLSSIFGEEMGLRNLMGQNQNQGVMGQIGVLQQLMQSEEEKRLMNDQRAQQEFQNQQVLAQNDEQRKMQMIQMIMQLIQRFGGGNMNGLDLGSLVR